MAGDTHELTRDKIAAALQGSAVLLVVGGPDAGARVPLHELQFDIGTEPGCLLRLTDPSVSRRHLTARWTPGGLEVKDLGSTNGTLYLGSRLTEAVVPLGGTLALGETRVTVVPPLESLQVKPHPSPQFGELFGDAPAMRRLFALADQVAPSDVTVLVTGETGTGKDTLVREVHARSARAKGPLVVVDCGAVAANLIESELFGHEKGAFTGAAGQHLGAFERAKGGTLFLDEIGELPLDLQPKLLRALDNRSVQRVGGTERVPLDVRFVAATHRDLQAMAKKGTFRQDLYYRMSVAVLRVPSLRERAEDIPALVKRLLAQAGADFEATDEVLQLLQRHEWPGNVRELRNVAERAAAFKDVRLLYVDLANPAESSLVRVTAQLARQNFKDAKQSVVDAFEREYLRHVLERCGYNFSQASREADVDRNHLTRLARRHGLTRPGDE